MKPTGPHVGASAFATGIPQLSFVQVDSHGVCPGLLASESVKPGRRQSRSQEPLSWSPGFAGQPERTRNPGALFSDLPSPTGHVEIVAGPSGVYFIGGSGCLRCVADGVTTEIPYPGFSGVFRYRVGGDGTLWASHD